MLVLWFQCMNKYVFHFQVSFQLAWFRAEDLLGPGRCSCALEESKQASWCEDRPGKLSLFLTCTYRLNLWLKVCTKFNACINCFPNVFPTFWGKGQNWFFQKHVKKMEFGFLVKELKIPLSKQNSQMH